MNWVDFAIIGIILISAVISLFRGFIKEALSLASWVIAFWVALKFSNDVAGLLVKYIETQSFRSAAAFAAIFVCVVVLGAIINFLAWKLVQKSGLTGTDRALGMVFGIARGFVVVVLLVLLAGLTPMPKDQWWKKSMLMVHFQNMAVRVRAFLPEDVRKNIIY